MFPKVTTFILGFLLIEAKFFDDLLSLDLDLDLQQDADIWADRLRLLEKSVDKASRKNFNISVAAWQYIYDSQGNIEEIDAIELVFPAKDSSKVNNDEELPGRADQYGVIRKFGPYVDQGFLVDVLVEHRNEKGEEDVLFYWNHNSTFFRTEDGLVTFNKTQIATKEEVDNFVEKLGKGSDFLLQPLIVTFDKFPDTTFNQSSITTPSVVAYVVDLDGASDEIIRESPLLLTQIYLTTEAEHIPEQLAKRFDAKFPSYDWIVLVNAKGRHITRDVCISLSLDGFEFYDQENPIYSVCGVLKK